jgi:hypothetical protein
MLLIISFPVKFQSDFRVHVLFLFPGAGLASVVLYNAPYKCYQLFLSL